MYIHNFSEVGQCEAALFTIQQLFLARFFPGTPDKKMVLRAEGLDYTQILGKTHVSHRRSQSSFIQREPKK